MFFDDHVIETAARMLPTDYIGRHLWFGLSAEPVHGDAVARHLEAANQLMVREGWDPQFYAPLSGHSITDALRRTAADGLGDQDTQHVARNLIELLLRARTGATTADADVWGERAERTLTQITDALTETAAFARCHGLQHAAH